MREQERRTDNGDIFSYMYTITYRKCAHIGTLVDERVLTYRKILTGSTTGHHEVNWSYYKPNSFWRRSQYDILSDECALPQHNRRKLAVQFSALHDRTAPEHRYVLSMFCQTIGMQSIPFLCNKVRLVLRPGKIGMSATSRSVA